MNAARVAELARDIADRAEELHQELAERVERPPYGDIFALRRSLDSLEDELRTAGDNAIGDAC